MMKLKHYQTIDEFQKDYPDRERREAFVRTLTNEEIDELIDLCGTHQGKIYYQRMKKQELVFGYKLSDAWLAPLSAVRVEDGPDGACVRYFSNEGDGCFPRTVPDDSWKTERIGRNDVKRIRAVLDDDRLFETEELEESVLYLVLDGYRQEFELFGKNRYIKATGSNIQACRGDTEYCPHSVLMAETLERIREILVPIGIPEKCLLLTRP